MDPDQRTPRKNKHRPTLRRREPKPLITNPKTEEAEGNDVEDGAADQALRQRIDEHLGIRGPKPQKKSSVQVAFGPRVGSSGSIRSFGPQREGNSPKLQASGSKMGSNDEKPSVLPKTVEVDGISRSITAMGPSSAMKKKEYLEPWDYNRSYYPVTLPLRPPYSGDPELLDQEEFGKAAMDLEYDETTINSALELGLLEENDKPQMLFIQLPTALPLEKRQLTAVRKGVSISAKGKEKIDEFRPLKTGFGPKNCCSLEELPKGHMGKLLVYKSGAIKWKMGEVVYDVSPGVNCTFAQEIVAINTDEKHICSIGEVSKRAVVTPAPEIESLFNKRLDLV